MYLVMSRAIKNVGDDLIYQRGLGILRHVAPSADFVQGKGWLPLPASVELRELPNVRAIIVPGGPGARSELDSVYPFLKDAQTAKIPVYFLGVGTRYFPGTFALARRPLDSVSRGRLQAFSQAAPIGVRDYVSLELLRHNGVRAQLNGCPAWYALDHIAAPAVAPKQIRSVAFTTAADMRFLPQSLALLRALRAQLPAARVLIGFHRGIAPSADTPEAEARGNQEIIAEAKRLGCEYVDVSGSSDRLQEYASCDLHVGYRVHAHIYFLSTHKPSILIAEDARGVGVLHALGGAGRAGWTDVAEHTPLRIAAGRFLPTALVVDGAEITRWLELTLEREADTGYPQVSAASSVIAHCWETRMKPFVEKIFAGG